MKLKKSRNRNSLPSSTKTQISLSQSAVERGKKVLYGSNRETTRGYSDVKNNNLNLDDFLLNKIYLIKKLFNF